MHISSSYAKILGEKLFRTWEIPRSGSKAEDGEREKRGPNDGNNNGQATHGARKPPGPKLWTLRLGDKGKALKIKVRTLGEAIK